jgi:hypothetical protein
LEVTHSRWTIAPQANIGIPTGEVSGFVVLDVDPRHGGDDALWDLERKHGPLPKTVRQITGGGGEHILFRHVPGLRNSAGKIAPGLDIRADGGYIVVSPSVHESGKRYAWDVDHHPCDVAIADAPAWLLELAQPPQRADGAIVGHDPGWAQLFCQPCPEGQRNDTLARLTGYLLRKYVDPLVVIAIVRDWNLLHCQPPLPDEEVIQSINSIAGIEINRRNKEAA